MTGGTDADNKITGTSQTGSIFLSHLRHELRTPLNAILGYSEMLLEDVPEDEVLIGGVQEIHSTGKHLLDLVNNILDPEKIEANREGLKLESFGVRISSELRAPLDSVIGRTRSLLETAEAGDYADFIPDLGKIHTAANNLLAFIEEIEKLSVTDPSMNRSKPDRPWVPIVRRSAGIARAWARI